MTRIAILSDSHDQIAHLTRALEAANTAGASALLHCGDLCAPFMLNLIGERFPGAVHVVFGNNDGDGRLLQTIASKHPHVTLHGVYAELTIEGRQIAMIHYPEPARRIAQSGQFDLVCYGHDHTRWLEQVGKGWLLNPGEVLGMKGQATWALYDTQTGEVAIQTL
ncbi:YfcE family phosphodiesterase [Caldilinea sp.]|uniref:YfcE family phosphodiesterase n=1 Tax=Caldilinea sp. TaxID=2293560 RepID=UPI0021DDADE6|nr:YfcE family phosphodiesterase [Caldilinea sp.]GIV70869.1 MAG: phosphoesterase [Caldilinea sp.]